MGGVVCMSTHLRNEEQSVSESLLSPLVGPPKESLNDSISSLYHSFPFQTKRSMS